jgi:hypothetical protein
METLHDKKQHHHIKKNIKVDKKMNYTTDRPTPIKVYFPNISINKISDIINPDKIIGNKTNKSNTIDISKYLVDESSKILIYSSTGIFEMVNNNLFQLYPIDKHIKELTINNNLKLLLDGSYMKRYDTPSYQIPYHHNIKYKTIRTYKNDIKSNIKFVIEIENESIYDFYVLITSAEVTNNENRKTELNKFVKDEILSFLSRLNLYR